MAFISFRIELRVMLTGFARVVKEGRGGKWGFVFANAGKLSELEDKLV